MSGRITRYVPYPRLSPHIFLACVFLLLIASAARSQTHGKDGALTVSGAGQVVNIYTVVTADITAPASTISVDNTTGITAGDLVMIYQVKGASISTTDDASYGTVTGYNSAGLYELRGVLSVTTNSVTLTGALRNSYTTAGRTQLIRIPQYTSLTVNNGASIVAQPWNGLTGGVVALHVQGTATINGSIDASGRGFRGGALTANGSQTLQNDVTFRTTSADIGAVKGEGIADSAALAGSGFLGRGAAANAGGGGNRHNAGGGGGANGDNGNTWTGHGVMCTSCTGSSAWGMDPAGSGQNSSGGGRGGYTYSANDMNATVSTGRPSNRGTPGNSGWGGDYREERGGWGGHPVANDPQERLFMGGGGGAGHQNNSAGGAGGNGGGIVFLHADEITGSGSIISNGNAGGNTSGTGNDVPGGGGAGGTLIAYAETSLTGIALSANGGDGGSQFISQAAHGNEAEGPGGGGGGGYIATANGSGASQSANGGANGTSNSVALTEFPANGATAGATGQTFQSIGSMPMPVELVSFQAFRRDMRVDLRWRTATEINNFGFEIERRIADGVWERIGFVPGHGSSASPKDYSFIDMLDGTGDARSRLAYRLRQVDRDGSFEYSPLVELHDGAVAETIAMDAPYPLPANDRVVLPFRLRDGAAVTLRLVNALGQEVRRLKDGEFVDAGSHAVSVSVADLPSGHYLFELRDTGRRVVRTLVVRR